MEDIVNYIVSSFLYGVSFVNLIFLVSVCFIYFTKKRLINKTTKVFNILLILTAINVFADLLSYTIGSTGYFIGKVGMSTILVLYIVSSLGALSHFAYYCSLVTIGKRKRVSKRLMYYLGIPVAIVCTITAYLIATDNFIYVDDYACSLSDPIFNVIQLYNLYYIVFISIELWVFNRGRKINYIVNMLGVLQAVIIIYVANTYGIVLESSFLTLNIFLLYNLIQYPVNQVDNTLGCYGPKALQTMLKDYELQKEEFYMLTIDILYFKYYVSKYGDEIADEIVAHLVESLPKDNRFTAKYRYNRDIIVILSTSEKEINEISEFWETNTTQTWYISDIRMDISFIITKYTSDYSVEEPTWQFLDKYLNFENKDAVAKFVSANERRLLMNREYEVLDVIRNAIRHNKFQVYFQPIYNVKTGKFDKMEALARLIDEKLGFIPPDEFITISEKNGLISDVSKQVIDKTLMAMNQYNLVAHGIDKVNINLSSVELEDLEALEYLQKVMKIYQVEPSNITIEITETAEGDSDGKLAKIVDVYRGKGFSMALDDYGTGYSNISRIISIPFDYIKIDKTLLYSADKSDTNNILLENSVVMLKKCGFKTVVEGVETAEHVEKMNRLGVDYIQGFYFARPMPIDKLIAEGEYIK